MPMPGTAEDVAPPDAPRGSAAVPGVRSRNRRLEPVAALLPSVAAVIAWVVHRTVPNQQNAEPTHLYPRLLLLIAAGGIVLAVLRLLWRPKAPVARDALNWCVRTAPILAAG